MANGSRQGIGAVGRGWYLFQVKLQPDHFLYLGFGTRAVAAALYFMAVGEYSNAGTEFDAAASRAIAWALPIASAVRALSATNGVSMAISSGLYSLITSQREQ
jgi:hypothetical protein